MLAVMNFSKFFFNLDSYENTPENILHTSSIRLKLCSPKFFNLSKIVQPRLYAISILFQQFSFWIWDLKWKLKSTLLQTYWDPEAKNRTYLKLIDANTGEDIEIREELIQRGHAFPKRRVWPEEMATPIKS